MIFKTLWTLIAFLLVLTSWQAWALEPHKKFHQYVLDQWSLEQGLPQISVGSITQGPDGYMWFGTQAGLARFDGSRFVNFSPDNTPAMTGNYVQALYTDSDGRLWVGTYKGVMLYQQMEFSAIPIAPDNQVLKTSLVYVNDIAEDTDGRVLVASNEGLWQITDIGLATYFNTRPEAAFSILRHREGTLIGATGEIWRIRQGTYETLPLPEGYKAATVQNLEQSGEGLVLLGTSKGLLIFDGERIVPHRSSYNLANQPIDALLTDTDDNVWVGSIGGLFRLRNGAVVEFIDNDNPATFQQILAIYEDREGSLWLGSYRHGVARVWNGRTERLSVQEGLHEQLTWSVAVAENGKAVWVGTNDGLSIFENDQYRLIVPGQQLPHPTAYTLLVEPTRVWVGTRSGAALWANGRIQLPRFLSAISSFQINAIYRATDNRLWFATSGGVFVYDGLAMREVREPSTNSSYFARPITQTKSGRILIGTQKGLFEAINDNLIPLGLNAGLSRALDVSSVHELDDGRLVISTISRGLFMTAGDRWRNFSEDDGLPVNESFYVTSDALGYLWVSGFRGLYRVPISNFQAYMEGRITKLRAEMLLSESGGIIGSQKAFCCNGAGNAKGLIHQGVLWYPTRGGVIKVDTTGIAMNPLPPPVRIERIRYAGEWHQVRPNETVTLPAHARDVMFEYTALTFRDPKSVRFQYMLEGYDESWQSPEHLSQRNVAYTNLPAGNYTLLIKGANNAGVWNQNPARLSFTITPYFYETWWFYLIIFSLLTGSVYWWHRHRIHALQAKRKELENEVEQRTTELSVANARLLKAVKALNETSQTDPLTGLKNRRYLVNQLPSDLSHFRRELSKTPDFDEALIFVVVDIDYFKAINDDYGHKAGDEVLQQFAQIILENIRKGDYAVRWGGEEFVIVFRAMPMEVAPQIIDRLRQRIQDYEFQIEGHESLQVTCSIGYAEYPYFRDAPNSLSWEHTIELADHALYLVKENGRNGWASFRPTPRTSQENLLANVQHQLQDELNSGRLRLLSSWTHPQYSSRDAKDSDV